MYCTCAVSVTHVLSPETCPYVPIEPCPAFPAAPLKTRSVQHQEPHSSQSQLGFGSGSWNMLVSGTFRRLLPVAARVGWVPSPQGTGRGFPLEPHISAFAYSISIQFTLLKRVKALKLAPSKKLKLSSLPHRLITASNIRSTCLLLLYSRSETSRRLEVPQPFAGQCPALSRAVAPPAAAAESFVKTG